MSSITQSSVSSPIVADHITTSPRPMSAAARQFLDNVRRAAATPEDPHALYVNQGLHCYIPEASVSSGESSVWPSFPPSPEMAPVRSSLFVVDPRIYLSGYCPVAFPPTSSRAIPILPPAETESVSSIDPTTPASSVDSPASSFILCRAIDIADERVRQIWDAREKKSVHATIDSDIVRKIWTCEARGEQWDVGKRTIMGSFSGCRKLQKWVSSDESDKDWRGW